MSIKYHQYGIGNEYGEDHTLTNNWNPDIDYRNEYVRVYFRIDTPSYHYERGFSSTEDRDSWDTEASNLISSFGIMEDSGYKVDNGKEKCAYLYAHPQQISGVILKNDVKRIAEAISNMKLFMLFLIMNTRNILTEEKTKFARHYLKNLQQQEQINIVQLLM